MCHHGGSSWRRSQTALIQIYMYEVVRGRLRADSETHTQTAEPRSCMKLEPPCLCQAALPLFLSKVIRTDPLPSVSTHDRKSKCHITASTQQTLSWISSLATSSTFTDLVCFQFEPEPPPPRVAVCVCVGEAMKNTCHSATLDFFLLFSDDK